MPPDSHSSGNLLADRRFEYGRLLAESGDHAAAADLYAQALELVPSWAAGWFALGAAYGDAGDTAGAARAFARLAELDPDDRYGGRLRLAALGRAPVPDAAPEAYVRELFDDYADRFETALVDRLGYRAPALLAEAIAASWPGNVFGHVHDLGCGTGLMAAALVEAGLVAGGGRIEGVDLSPAMVATAADKALYAELRVGDVVADLGRAGPAFDLVVAADVFVYIGDLAPVFAAVAARLDPGALFAFTAEAADDGDNGDGADVAGEGWRLGASLRYAHVRTYLAGLAAAHGFRPLSEARATLRQDRGSPVIGHVIVLQRGADPIEDDARA
ncbi:class I SAM-dependent DNA methyltransferase [Methylobrevis albus]|uniref:Methyltransferase domain-containing protein n=1 Tax=Methylobrevis albus TaxID=2793297 RepID=A0A931MXW9_9HYPH|nr:methyltransferase domain-containing protein [Methylobrevis albus]MBH0237415.1 methyltransferase domain-containing protein [Methylobrevis albus]